MENVETVFGAVRRWPRMSRSDKIKAIRKQAGLTMQEAADGMGYAFPSSWQAFENSRTEYVHPDDLELLLKIFVGRAARGREPVTAEQILALGGPMISHYWRFIQVINRLSPEAAERAMAYMQGLGDQEGTKSRR